MIKLRERGQVIPLIAVSLGALLGFGGIGVDVGYLEYSQQSQQTATDAAALGGAQQLMRSGCANAVVAKNSAKVDAGHNGFADGGNVSVSVVSPPQAGPFSGQACAMDVTISTQHVATYFARLFGYPGGMQITTHAVAVVSKNNAACIYLLSPVVQTNINGATIVAPGCAIAINDTANFNGSTIGSPSIGYAGGTPNQNGSTFTMATPAPMLEIADPCPEIAGCAYLAANPPSTGNCQSGNYNGQHATLQPGCYSSINLNNATVTLMPGPYVFTGSGNFSGATITGSGITWYVAAGGTPPNFNGDTITLSPPTTGNWAGVLYYQVPSNTNSPNFNGTNVSYSGLMYAPGATQVNFNGAAGNYLVLVFGAINYNGSANWDFATPAPGQSLTSKAVIAQ